jgi:succinyl-CoA synthetase alpha subunit
VRRNAYVDSVTLLQVTSEVLGLTGVADAALVMATDLNREVLRDAGLLVGDAATASQNDLVIAVRATDEEVANGAVHQAEAFLTRRRPVDEGASARLARRSLRSAHRADPEANLALISVPGPFAAAEARQALGEGLHVFLFSDNVSVEDEIALKRTARELGLLVMGPDCGTAILNGIGLGFANVVRRGPIGVIGASGTGIQEIVSLVHQAGCGISQAIGTGSRDLHRAVGGITTLQAIELLSNHPLTETIVLVSKPSDPEVAGRVLHALDATGKRTVAYLQGSHVEGPAGVMIASNLEEAARFASGTLEKSTQDAVPRFGRSVAGRVVHGLFCGGTLCAEAAAIVNGAPHTFVDFGDDRYTRGRAHPMIDPTLRNQAIVDAGRDRRVGVVLLDFILGLGSHADPAGAAESAIRRALSEASDDGRQLQVLAHVVGTDADPQGLAHQEATLKRAGAHVFASNAGAATEAKVVLEAVAT